MQGNHGSQKGEEKRVEPPHKPPCEEKTGGAQGLPGRKQKRGAPNVGRPCGGGSFAGSGAILPGGLKGLFGRNEGDMMALMILLLLLWEGGEESGGTILTLLLFFIL